MIIYGCKVFDFSTVKVGPLKPQLVFCRDVIEDQDFTKELNRLKEEPIPYFSMIPREDEEEEEGEVHIEEAVKEEKTFEPVKVCAI